MDKTQRQASGQADGGREREASGKAEMGVTSGQEVSPVYRQTQREPREVEKFANGDANSESSASRQGDRASGQCIGRQTERPLYRQTEREASGQANRER